MEGRDKRGREGEDGRGRKAIRREGEWIDGGIGREGGRIIH